MQVGQLGDHGHMDSGALTHYGSDYSYYFDYATLRLDEYLEAHNVFTLRDPVSGLLWSGTKSNPADYAAFTTEDVSVPVVGITSEASYARILTREYPGTVTDAASWNTVTNWNIGWTKEQAIGYRNWPIRLNRS